MQDTFILEQVFSHQQQGHNSPPSLVTVAGVFDGHGGSAVAHFVQKRILNEIRQTRSFEEAKYGQALTETYLHIDEMLRDAKYESELQELESMTSSGYFPHTPSSHIEDDEHRETDLLTPQSDDSITHLTKRLRTRRIAERCGTTALCAVIDGSDVTISNVGDSRAVLCRAGRAIRLTQDHRPGNAKEMPRIKAAGGSVVNGRINGKINVSRTIGDLRFKSDPMRLATQQMVSANPDIVRHQITSEDEFMIIATDGIWECITDQMCVDEIRDGLMRPNSDATQILDQLLDHCLAPHLSPDRSSHMKGADNMTCMVLVFGSAPTKQ